MCSNVLALRWPDESQLANPPKVSVTECPTWPRPWRWKNSVCAHEKSDALWKPWRVGISILEWNVQGFLIRVKGFDQNQERFWGSQWVNVNVRQLAN